MQIIVRNASGEIDIDVRQERPDADIADLVARLTPESIDAAVPVFVDGRQVAADLGFDEAGLVHGSVIEIGRSLSAPAAIATARPEGLIELVVVGGPVAGRSLVLEHGASVGRSMQNDLVIPDMTVSPMHAEVHIDASGGVGIEDLHSHNGTRHNGAPVRGRVEVHPGDIVEIGATALMVRPALVTDRPVGVDARRSAVAGSVAFNRPPRQALPPALDGPDVPAAPIEERRGKTASALTLIGPILMGIVMVKVMGNIRFALFALMSPVMFITNAFAERRRAKSESKSSRRQFRIDLESFTAAIVDLVAGEKDRREQLYPDLAEVVRRVALPSTRLWERRYNHPDYLRLRVGRGPQPWQAPIDSDAVAAHPDLEAAAGPARSIANCAIDITLAGNGVIGLVGDRQAALGLARSLVLQAAVHHGPADLSVSVLTDRMRATDWDWAKWLPHVRGADGTSRRLLADTEAVNELMQAMLDQAEPGNGSKLQIGGVKVEGPATLVIVDDESLTTGRRSPTRAVLRGKAGPVAGIVIAPTADQLPAVCNTVVVLRDDLGDAELHRPQAAQVISNVVIDGLDDPTARTCARQLARYEDPEIETAGAGIPAMVRLLPLLGMDNIDAATVANAWQQVGLDPAPAAPIGIGQDGIVELNMVTDGPHGLVGGTTGSGKSEFLRSLVAGMAARVSPQHLVFVLVDYKGGSAFDECARLPHTVGLVTDLDEHLGERALKSLEAELHRRERQLREAGATDLPEYLKMGATLGPMPRLLLVVDEFATMAAELPDFMGALVGIAQRGRSLGVHMLLATQRPSGAVNANIKANTNMRIALRVQDAGDSMDVIDRNDAAEISRSTPGRAYVRLGPSEVISVQTALSTAPPTGVDSAAVTVAPFRFGPRPSAPAMLADVGDDAPSELVQLVDACIEAFDQSGIAAPRQPWLDMLPETLPLDQVLDSAEAGQGSGASPFVVPIGLADDPEAQAQLPSMWSPDEGHLAFLGMVGSGTSTALVSTVLGAATVAGADDLHIYGIDYGGGALTTVAGLPHVGAVVAPSEREKQVRLVRFLHGEIDRRRTLDAETRASEPRLLLAIDGASPFLAEYDGLEGQETSDSMKRILADGAAVRVHVVVTASRSMDIPMRMMSPITQRLMLKHSDPSDFGAIGVRTKSLPELMPGRGIHSETTMVTQVGWVDNVAGAVADLVASRRASWRPPAEIKAMPAAVAVAEVGVGNALDGAVEIPIGLDGDTMDVLRLALYPGEHVFVGGVARSGVSTTLELVARQLRAVDDNLILVAIADARSPLGRIDDELFDAVGTLETLATVLKRAATDTDKNWLIVVDDAHLIEDAEALEPLLKGSKDHVRVVAGARSDQLKGSFTHWTRGVRRSGRGILLQPRLDSDGDLLGVRLPRRLQVPLVPGRGFVVADGETTLVQVAGADLAA